MSEKELSDPEIKKEYSLDKMSINSRLIELGFGSEVITKLLSYMNEKGRTLDIRDFIKTAMSYGVNKDTIISFMRSIGISDSIILKIMSYIVV